MLAVDFEITFQFVQSAVVLLQHKGRFQQTAEDLLVENWFVVIGHFFWHGISQARSDGRCSDATRLKIRLF